MPGKWTESARVDRGHVYLNIILWAWCVLAFATDRTISRTPGMSCAHRSAVLLWFAARLQPCLASYGNSVPCGEIKPLLLYGECDVLPFEVVFGKNAPSANRWWVRAYGVEVVSREVGVRLWEWDFHKVLRRVELWQFSINQLSRWYGKPWGRCALI